MEKSAHRRHKQHGPLNNVARELVPRHIGVLQNSPIGKLLSVERDQALGSNAKSPQLSGLQGVSR